MTMATERRRGAPAPDRERDRPPPPALEALELPAVELGGDPPRATAANRAAQALFGRAGSTPGEVAEWARRVLGDDEAALSACAAEVLRHGGTRTLEHRCQAADGRVRWMATAVQPGRAGTA